MSRIFVAPADFSGSGFYRIIQPFSALRDKGHDVVFIDRHDDLLYRYESRPGDTLVLQRQTSRQSLALIQAFKQMGGYVVYEFDDNFHALPPDNPFAPVYGSGKPATKIGEHLTREAYLVIVSTQDLKDEYRRYNPNIIVCENAIEDKRLTQEPITGEPKRPGEIRIGYAASGTHEADFATVAKPIAKVMTDHPEARMVFIGADMRKMLPREIQARTEYVGRTETPEGQTVAHIGESLPVIRYYEMIRKADFDLAIAPLRPLTFNRCKSALKLMEYGALAIPAIASHFGPYAKYGQTVRLATTDKEWSAALTRLIEAKDERRNLAQANLTHIKTHHVLSKKIEQWEAALRMLPATIPA